MNSATKDNEILRYYEAEMRYLREAGKEFARAFPDRARMLNIDRIGERDPYVERLFEGFAFLMGRLRHKLDDELPELTEGLVSMLWPHYLRMIPSLSILELSPTNGALQKHETLAAGLEVASDPIPAGSSSGAGDEGVECTGSAASRTANKPRQLVRRSEAPRTAPFASTCRTATVSALRQHTLPRRRRQREATCAEKSDWDAVS
jgi:type VI protein secretion system component VasA